MSLIFFFIILKNTTPCFRQDAGVDEVLKDPVDISITTVVVLRDLLRGEGLGSRDPSIRFTENDRGTNTFYCLYTGNLFVRILIRQ